MCCPVAVRPVGNPGGDGEKMLETKDLTFSYQNDAPLVLDGVDLNVREGEFLVILGRNGSGKSTLAKHFNAILLPSGGTVTVLGMDTADENLLFDIRQAVGMVFQNPDNQIVATVVEEDVAFAPENLGVPSAEIRRRVEEALETVGMLEYRKHAPHLLSGGQKQRVAIAGVIAMMPKCIVLDEPTAMLDPVGRREVIRTVRKLNQQHGITVVLITHNMDEAVEADRVIVMHQGHIVKEGTPREIFSDVTGIQSMGLDVPQVTEIAYELKKEGFDIRGDVLTCDEFIGEIERLMGESKIDG